MLNISDVQISTRTVKLRSHKVFSWFLSFVNLVEIIKELQNVIVTFGMYGNEVSNMTDT